MSSNSRDFTVAGTGSSQRLHFVATFWPTTAASLVAFRVFWACLLTLVVIGPQYASAATFYVNNSGSPVCHDATTAGTQANPFCTPDYGTSRIASGDTLYVRSGSYNISGGFWGITGPSGTASAPTHISVYPGDTVTLVGQGVNTGRVKFSNVGYMTFDGFQITNFNQGILAETVNNITITNCQVYDVGQEAIHIRYNSSFVTISGCTVHDTGKYAFDGEGFYIGSSTSETTVDNTNNVTLKKNTTYNTADEGIELKPGTHDCIVDGNNISAANLNDLTPGYGGAAIEVNEAVAAPQHWDSNPNHIIRNNFIHNTGPGSGAQQIYNSGIRLGTGSLAYNNVIYGIQANGAGIIADNNAGDSYSRMIYHNTIDLPNSRAVSISGAPTDIRNNIGPTSTNNLGTSSSYYKNAGTDYHLVAGAAPINVGVDLTGIVSVDIEGNNRTAHMPPDLGAYEYVGNAAPNPPTNVKAVAR